MPLEFITTNTIGAGTIRALDGPDENLIVVAGVTLGSTDSAAISVSGANNASIQIDGTLAAAANTIAGFLSTGTRLSIGATGLVFSTQTVSGFANIALGASADLINHGIISTPSTTAVLIGGSDSQVFNTGTVVGTTGLRVEGAAFRLVNEGDILGTGHSTDPGSTFNGVGVCVTGSDARIINGETGTISSTAGSGASSAGVRLLNASNGSVVQNLGEIIAAHGIGVDFAGMLGTESAILRNVGVITGGTASFDGNETGDTVTNSGLMMGDVRLNDGADLYRAMDAGRVDGDVLGGAGNDTLRGAAGDDSLAGEADSDLASGGAGDDTLEGGSGADTLAGNIDEDALFGGSENDLLYGGIGDDRLFGETEADRLEGGAGQDRLDGGNGEDVLLGGSGEDTLIGRAGFDTLFGGTGTDDFVFRNVAEIGTALGLQDIIHDFEVGQDVLDLSLLDANALVAGNQAFTFIGAAAFGGITAQLRYSTANGRLQGDVNGDGIADFSLLLSNRAALTVDDIVL